MTTVYTLGTAGGPRWWRAAPGETPRSGIATAIAVGDATYVVDCGAGTWSNFVRAGLDPASLEAVLLTHLHSDHVVELPSLALFGLFDLERRDAPLPVLGPGDRGGYHGYDERLNARAIGGPGCTPGTRELLSTVSRAFATDINERILDSRRARPDEVLDPRDIEIPASAGFHADASPTPDHEPFVVFEDSRVRITAALVQHPPVAPAFAFRLDSDEGSVTISGDTAECRNVARLAEGTDLLLHEAIDPVWLEQAYRSGTEQANALLSHHLRSHTKPEGAVRIADEAGARRLVLHHLVPGTTSLATWRDVVAGFDRTVDIAEDGQVFQLSTVSTPN